MTAAARLQELPVRIPPEVWIMFFLVNVVCSTDRNLYECRSLVQENPTEDLCVTECDQVKKIGGRDGTQQYAFIFVHRKVFLFYFSGRV
jgi:hypothetical protein